MSYLSTYFLPLQAIPPKLLNTSVLFANVWWDLPKWLIPFSVNLSFRDCSCRVNPGWDIWERQKSLETVRNRVPLSGLLKKYLENPPLGIELTSFVDNFPRGKPWNSIYYISILVVMESIQCGNIKWLIILHNLITIICWLLIWYWSAKIRVKGGASPVLFVGL